MHYNLKFERSSDSIYLSSFIENLNLIQYQRERERERERNKNNFFTKGGLVPAAQAF